MGYKLEKPYTNKQRADFVCEHQGLTPCEDDNYFYMIEDYEELQDGEIVDVSGTQEYQAKQLTKLKENCCCEYKEQLLQLKSEDELNQFFKKTGIISDATYNERLAVITADIATLQAEYLESEE